MQLVLDASVAAAWCFPDEASDYTEMVLDSVSSNAEALVPSLWPYEIANVILVARRTKRLTDKTGHEFLSSLRELGIRYDNPAPGWVFAEVMQTAERHSLTAYDGAYLELALREGLPLATLDQSLRRAALASGLRIYGE